MARKKNEEQAHAIHATVIHTHSYFDHVMPERISQMGKKKQTRNYQAF